MGGLAIVHEPADSEMSATQATPRLRGRSRDARAPTTTRRVSTTGAGRTDEAADPAFVVTSEVTISPDSEQTLEHAFRERLHLVEAAPGFQRIEIWRDLARPGVFTMVSWWDCSDSFRRYMRSDEHRMSHDRIPVAPERPRGTGVRRYALVPDSHGDATGRKSSGLPAADEATARGGV